MGVGIELTIIAIAYVLFSVSIQRKLIDMKHMREVQEIIKAKSKELNDMAKQKVSQEVLMAKQKEITTLLGQSMKSQLKPMFVVLPIFFVVYYLVFPAVFATNPNVTVPIISMTMNYKSYFILVAFILGLLLTVALMLRDRMRLAKEKRQAESAEQ